LRAACQGRHFALLYGCPPRLAHQLVYGRHFSLFLNKLRQKVDF
jgi:predicted transcriptional regulator